MGVQIYTSNEIVEFGYNTYRLINLGAITLMFGLKLRFNFATIFGLGISYYFLRYFR